MFKYNKKTNVKLAAVFLAVSLTFLGLTANNFAKAEEVKPTEVTVNAVTSTVSTNMLDVNTSVITEVTLQNLVGKNQEIRAKFSDLPKCEEKIFAVLVDAAAGGVIDCKYLEDKSVTFSNIAEYIKIPGIHLYKQGFNDPEFLLRKENFIASTSYLMPYGKKINNNGGLTSFNLTACRGNGSQYDVQSVPQATLYTTTVPDVYSFALPSTIFKNISGAEKLTAKDIFAVIIADDENGKPVEVHSVVSTDYNESSSDPSYLCRFEFLLPKGIKNFQVHIYKKALYEENFVCKFLGAIDKQPATSYNLP